MRISDWSSDVCSSDLGPKPGFKRAAKVQPAPSDVAPIRDEDISDPRFKGIDPWLAKRISPGLAEKLNPKNKIHPTIFEDKLICLEDGSEVKLLRSYVKKNFKLDFHQYMSKWNLPSDYTKIGRESTRDRVCR